MEGVTYPRESHKQRSWQCDLAELVMIGTIKIEVVVELYLLYLEILLHSGWQLGERRTWRKGCCRMRDNDDTIVCNIRDRQGTMEMSCEQTEDIYHREYYSIHLRKNTTYGDLFMVGEGSQYLQRIDVWGLCAMQEDRRKKATRDTDSIRKGRGSGHERLLVPRLKVRERINTLFREDLE